MPVNDRDPLNDREKAQLAQLEAQLALDDPELDARLDGRKIRSSDRALAPKVRYGTGVLAGLASLPVAVELSFWPLGLAGYAVAALCGTQLIRLYGRRAYERAKARVDGEPAPPRQ